MIDDGQMPPRSADSRRGSIAECEAAPANVWRALATVTDPEIPVLNIVEMGIVAAVRTTVGRIEVDITPTFAGCPAISVICGNVREALSELGPGMVKVNVVYEPPWTSDRMTADGHSKLQQFGLAPPGPRCTGTTPDLEGIACPHCHSTNTDLESIFGPTLCRSIHYCHSCLQSFEHFKAI